MEFTHAMSDLCGSPFWNSSLSWHTEDPVLGSCLQRTLMVWIPCGVLWLLTPFRLFHLLLRRPRDLIPWNFLQGIKVVTSLILMALTLTDLSYGVALDGSAFSVGQDLAKVTLITPLVLQASLALQLLMVLVSRRRGERASGIIWTFWALQLVCGLPQLKSTFQLVGEGASPSVSEGVFLAQYAGGGLLFLANCFADAPSESMASKDTKTMSPEYGASFPNRLVFGWVEGLVWRGWRRPLVEEDLFDLPPEHTSKNLGDRWRAHWSDFLKRRRDSQKLRSRQELKAKIKKKKKYFDQAKDLHELTAIHEVSRDFEVTSRRAPKNMTVLPVLVRMFHRRMLLAAFLYFVIQLVQFLTPQLLSIIINFIHDTTEPSWRGFLYAAALLAVTCAHSILRNHFFVTDVTLSLQIKSTLVFAIFGKALRLSNTARNVVSVGEVVNLMAVDASRLSDLVLYLNLAWGGPLVVAIALYFLWGLLGGAALSGLSLLLLMVPANAVIAGRMKGLQGAQMALKDRRLRLTSEVLGGIKVLKLYAWELSFEEQIGRIRREEILIMKKNAFLKSLAVFLWFTTPYMVALVSFCTFILISEENVLDARTAFVAISLFDIIRSPITQFPDLIAHWVQARVALKRLNRFMNEDDLDPTAVTHDPSHNKAIVIRKGQFSWGGRGTGRGVREEGGRGGEKGGGGTPGLSPENLPKDIEDEEGEKTWKLSAIDLEVERGALVAVVGPVGSGKSSLVAAMLGEMTKEQGTVLVNGRVAYVAQQPWLQNATLRDNITWGKPINTPRYQRVLQACALTQDLEVLPGGDKAEIGEKGLNLSGGQRQRVALARALCSDGDIFLLDDPLSAVDSHVGRHIFEKVISPKGLLKGKTRVLVTHSVTFLPRVDHVVVLRDGKVAEQGTYAQLVAKEGAFAQFLCQHLKEDHNEEVLEMVGQLQTCLVAEKLLRRLSECLPEHHESEGNTSSLSTRKSEDESILEPAASSTKELSSPTPVVAPAEGRLVEEERAQHGKVSWAVYAFYGRAIGVARTLVPLVLFALAQAFQAGGNAWLSNWASQDFVNGTPQVWSKEQFLAGYAGCGLGQALCFYLASFTVMLGCLSSASFLHGRLLRSTLRLPMSFFDANPTGRIVNRFSKDVDVLDSRMPDLVRGWLVCIMQVLGAFVVITASTPLVAGALVPLVVVYYFVQLVYVATSRQLKRIESARKSPVYSHFLETIKGVATVRAFGRQEDFVSESAQRMDQAQNAFYLTVITNRWLGIRLEFIGNLVTFAAAIFAVFGRTSISPGIVGLSVSYALNVTMVLNWLVRLSSDVETNVVSVERLQEYIQEEEEAPLIVPQTAPPPSWPEHGQLSFCHYDTRYRPNLDLVLKGVSFEVQPREKIGVVGRTGAGKSSLALALFRIIEAAAGYITIDGRDVSQLGLHQLRSKLTIIPQDPFLFSGTVRENLDPMGSHGDLSLWRTLELTSLASFVRSLAYGLSHQVEEGGTNFSAGQRQLLCLARALLRRTRILILDEATAAVDLDTDNVIQATIRHEFADSTVLTIAHRLNTIMDSDKVLVLDNGKVAEFESPSTLLRDKNSLFFSLAKDAGIL
ncbi:ATP-binding cassette sub-family C member 3-like [Oratosquilla oratoria]|uniref:ATP-binding cassette sub-family C member 3-like n=1 Tax=Oratosquilla oratoria TaxID=337810 RepID=UPI003F773DD4